MVAAVLAVALLPVTAGNSATPASQGPADQYIVVLREDVANPRQVANEMASQYGLTVTHLYEHALKGFAARISLEQLPAVRADSRVQYVAEDREVQVFGQPLPGGVPPAAEDTGTAGEADGAGAGIPAN